MKVQDYYTILGVGRNATQLDIENAYEYFKTLYESGQVDAQRWQMIEEAYDILASVENRMLYDEVLKQEPPPIQSFSSNAIPVIDQTSAAMPETNTANTLVIGIAAAVILFVAVVGVLVANVSQEASQQQESIDYFETQIVVSRFTRTPSPTLTRTPTPITNSETSPTPDVAISSGQRCQITNPSENPVTIYSDMNKDSNLSVFLMPSQTLAVYRESDEAEWYLIAPDQVIEPGITIMGPADELDVIGDYLQAEDVQLDFCAETDSDG